MPDMFNRVWIPSWICFYAYVNYFDTLSRLSCLLVPSQLTKACTLLENAESLYVFPPLRSYLVHIAVPSIVQRSHWYLHHLHHLTLLVHHKQQDLILLQHLWSLVLVLMVHHELHQFRWLNQQTTGSRLTRLVYKVEQEWRYLNTIPD